MPLTRIHETAHRTGSLWGNRNFVLLWSAYTVSALGDHLSEFALLRGLNAANPAVDVTPLMARIMFAFFAGFAVLAPVAGVLADLLPRRAVMITADVARAVILFSLTWLLTIAHPIGTWGVFAPLALIGSFAALFSPARTALLPTLVGPNELSRANGLISGMGMVATMAATLLGGWLAQTCEPHVAFRINGGTFLFSAALVAMMTGVPRASRQTSQPPFESSRRSVVSSAYFEIKAGIDYVRRRRHVRELLLLFSLVWFFGPMINALLPAVARDAYAGHYGTMGLLRAMLGAGFILGAGCLALLGDALRSEVAVVWAFVGIGVSLSGLAASILLPIPPGPGMILGIICLVLAGMGTVTVLSSVYSLLQRTVRDRYRGRVFGVNDLCATAALLVATGIMMGSSLTRWDPWAGWIILGVAIGSGTAGVVGVWIRLGRTPLDRRLAFHVDLNEFVARWWWKMRRVGPSRIPRQGPVIIASNHRGPADPVFLGVAARCRPIAFLFAEEYSRWPVVRYYARLLHCVPVKRDGKDLSATKQAIRLLREGRAIGIFIEGRVVAPSDTAEPKDGVALLALRTGAPVIPAYISGVRYHDSVLWGLLVRHRARVRFGQPVDLSAYLGGAGGRVEIGAITRTIYQAIQDLASDAEPRNAVEPVS